MLRFDVLSYNVQAPFLPSKSSMQHCLPPNARRSYIWAAIYNTIFLCDKMPVFLCLQEVCEEWRLFFKNAMMVCFAMDCIEYNYATGYHKDKNGLFLMVFYQTEFFDCPKFSVIRTGTVTETQQKQFQLDINDVLTNQKKNNAVLGAKFILKHVGERYEFTIGTTHAPCAHQFPRSQRLHFANALSFVQEAHEPTILIGDFNVLPTDEAYTESVRKVSDAAVIVTGSLGGETCSSVDFVGRIDYAFSSANVKPLDYNLLYFLRSTYLWPRQPSDHALLSVRYCIPPVKQPPIA